MRKHRFENSTRVHEANYSKLVRLLPNIQLLLPNTRINSYLNGQKIEVFVSETTQYTTAIVLKINQHTHSPWLRQLEITIRSYHDARVAEVLNFQQHRNLQPTYHYPNPLMYQVNEKQQVNHFLGEWLDHWLDSKCIFSHPIEAIRA